MCTHTHTHTHTHTRMHANARKGTRKGTSASICEKMAFRSVIRSVGDRGASCSSMRANSTEADSKKRPNSPPSLSDLCAPSTCSTAMGGI